MLLQELNFRVLEREYQLLSDIDPPEDFFFDPLLDEDSSEDMSNPSWWMKILFPELDKRNWSM